METANNGTTPPVRALVLDFGGVLAEEGFVNGLKRIARLHGLPEKRVLEAGEALVKACGYVSGKATEADFWEAFREETGIRSEDRRLRDIVLDGFTLRPRMLELVEDANRKGFLTAMLSDQTDWLEALDRKTPFLYLFDVVKNSFRTGRTKSEDRAYEDLLAALSLEGPQVLFVDDRPANLARAGKFGIRGVLCDDPARAEARLREELGI